jgi:O-antigen/teichoic acid export membrane protein
MMPVSIIARSVGDVFRQKATEMYNEHGSYRSLYLKTMAVLTLVGLIPFLTLIFFAPLLFTWVFGAEWTNAGEFAQILAILFIFQFVTSPLTNAFIISDKQQLELLWQIVFLLSSILPIIIGFYLYEEIQSVLLLFAASRAGAYILSIFLTLPFTEKRV